MKKEQTETKKGNTLLTTKNMVQIAMLAALATILMLFQMPLPFAPSFYKLDLSEVPILFGTFAMGPVAGVLIELIKILINFLIDGTATAGIGELANFLMGCALCVPAGIIYRRGKNKKSAVIGLGVGTVSLTVVGCLLNAFVLLPVYATAFYMPIDALVEMGTALNPSITSLTSFVLFAVAPFNLIKGMLVSVIVMFTYKKLRGVVI